MAREIVSWCDPCLVEDNVRTPARPYVVTLGVKPKSLDLCDPHAEKLWQPFVKLVTDYGANLEDNAPPKRSRSPIKPGVPIKPPQPTRPAEAATNTGRKSTDEPDVPCAICTDPPRWFANGTSLNRHSKTVHGEPTGALYGKACAICGVEFATFGGVTVHTYKAHGIEGGITAGYLAAEALGDPHGLVKRARDAARLRDAG